MGQAIECLALGGVIWLNPFDTLQKAVQTFQIDGIPDKMRSHFHILGITGWQKLIPLIIATKNNLFPGIERLSFDSTTMTQSWLFGNIHPSMSDLRGPTPKRSLGKARDKFVEEYFEGMYLWWKDNPQNIFNSAEDLLENSVFNSLGHSTAAKQYSNLGIENSIKTVAQKQVFVSYNTFKFFSIVESYMKGEIELHHFMGNYKQLPLLQALEKVTDLETFEEWLESARNRVDSN